ncbi:hypothetical protein ACU610_25795 [Geodermatophilus sp. URMC 61]|uniref:hypothetical protein n=1 Tax=Geodermatophilus sp. URMC 61 TaxID=3423411 RepID=UPI00406BFDAD
MRAGPRRRPVREQRRTPQLRRPDRHARAADALVAELHRHKAAQLGARMLAGSEWQDEDLISALPSGRPIDETAHDDWTVLLQWAVKATTSPS